VIGFLGSVSDTDGWMEADFIPDLDSDKMGSHDLDRILEELELDAKYDGVVDGMADAI